MRILLAHNSLYYPSYGGGDKSNRLLMEALAARGHAVRVVARVEHFGEDSHAALLRELTERGAAPLAQANSVEYGLNGVEVRILTREPALRAYFAAQIEAFDPEIILTSTDDAAHLMLETALRAPRARVVYLVRATIALPFGPDSGLRSSFQTEALREADGVVAVSEYVADYTRQWGGVEAIHVPISLLDAGEHQELGRFDNRYVCMVNPCAVKGISIFLALAERFPGVEFAAIPTWGTTAADRAALEKRPNVAVLAPLDDIDDLLRQTRVMLVPSLWAEARSRICLEAMSRGVPVMASNVGGLAEAMLGVDYLLPVNPVSRYHAAVDELMVPEVETPAQEVGPWAEVLERLLTDDEHYKSLSAEARRAALAYARDLNVGPFEAYLESVLSRPRKRAQTRSARSSTLSDERRRLLALRVKRARSHLSHDELARRLTRAARRALPGVDIEVLWDGMWVRRIGSYYFPDPDMFTGKGPIWALWAEQASKYLRDAEDYWFHVYKPRVGDVIVDIGAGRGEDAFAFSRAVGPHGRVWAIEPHPVSFAALRKLCELNRLSNVTPLNYACMDHAGELQIETTPVWESSYVRPGPASAASHMVRGVRFDDLAVEHGIDRIDFLKMNIEGAERLALEGCAEALRRARFVCIAAHDFRAVRGEGEHFRTLEFVKGRLRVAGYETVTRDDPRYYVPYHVHGVRP